MTDASDAADGNPTADDDKRKRKINRLPLWPVLLRPTRATAEKIAALADPNPAIPISRALCVSIATGAVLVCVAVTISIFSTVMAGLAVVVAAVITGILFRGLDNLVHGASHYDVFGDAHPRWNDNVADALMAMPVLTATESFRKNHVPDHHGGFGQGRDRCKGRMQRHEPVRRGELPTVWSTVCTVPADAIAFYRNVGASPTSLTAGFLWHATVFIAPLYSVFGFAGMLAWAGTMGLTFGITLPIIRALAEAGEHDYGHEAPSSSAIDSVFQRTFNNIGFGNKLLHLFDDHLHVEHHMWPKVPQYKLKRVQDLLHANDNQYRQLVRTRHTVLGAPTALRLEGRGLPLVAPQPPVNAANDNTKEAGIRLIVARAGRTCTRSMVRRVARLISKTPRRRTPRFETMEMLEIEIAQAVFATLPEFAVLGFRATDLNSTSSTWDEVVAPAEQRPAPAVDDIAAIPEIADWRNAYRLMGLKPSEYRSSVEQLVRRRARGTLPRIGVPAVDLYNWCSAVSLAPIGGYDLAQTSTDPIQVRHCAPDQDRFDPIGGSHTVFAMKSSVIVYAQGPDILCWALNYRDSRRTALTASTEEALFLSEATTGRGAAASKAALALLAKTLIVRGAKCGDIRTLDRETSAGQI